MKCKVNIGREIFDGEFMGLFQYSEIVAPSPMIGGHTGGVVSYPVAVVKVGKFLKQVRATSVHFEEEEPVEYIDSLEEFSNIMKKFKGLARYNDSSNKSRDVLFERESDKVYSDLIKKHGGITNEN